MIYGNPANSTVLNTENIPLSPNPDTSIYLSKPHYFSSIIGNLLQKLDRFAELKNNWDSYGAKAPTARVVQEAKNFLIENHYLDLPFYFIAPGVNGEIMLEFSKGNKAAEVFFTDNSTELLLYDNNKTVLEGTLENDFPALIRFFDD